MRRVDRLTLLGSLYLAQGVPFGFFTQAVPVVLRASGASLPWVGASSLLAVPWALKFLWAPWVDQHGSPRWGRRRSWLLPLQAATVAVLVGLAGVDPGRAALWLGVGMFVCSVLAATQDVATDGLAVDLLPPDERGLANGLQVGAYRLGMILGGSVVLWVYQGMGWRMAFLGMAALVAVSSFPVWAWREPDRVGRDHQPGLNALLAALRRPGLPGWILALSAYKVGDALAAAMVKPMLVDAGLSLAAIGALQGAGGSFAGLAGALAGGWLTGRLGSARALVGLGFAQALGAAIWVIPAWSATPEQAALWAAALTESFLGGMATAALFTAMMDACRSDHGATDYTVQACAVVLATGLAAPLAGVSAAHFGYAGHFALSAAIALAGIAPIARARLPADAGHGQAAPM